MAGRFRNAPLVYVTAQVRTSELPGLSSDQRAALEQTMIKLGLPELKEGKAREINLSQLQESVDDSPHIEAASFYRKITRWAFFNDTRTEGLVIERGSIEFRASEYTKYGHFIQRFQEILERLVQVVDAYSSVRGHELVLSYADVVVPYPGRELADYFKEEGKILPLNTLGQPGEQEQRFGQVQITRITAPNERIEILLEQLPLVEGAVRRHLPQAMVEPERQFAMPLRSVGPEETTSGSYGLLMTQAAKLEKKELGEMDVRESFDSLHEITKETFWTLLNEEVCKDDWEYTEN